jgi:hypothetical protein
MDVRIYDFKTEIRNTMRSSAGQSHIFPNDEAVSLRQKFDVVHLWACTKVRLGCVALESAPHRAAAVDYAIACLASLALQNVNQVQERSGMNDLISWQANLLTVLQVLRIRPDMDIGGVWFYFRLCFVDFT